MLSVTGRTTRTFWAQQCGLGIAGYYCRFAIPPKKFEWLEKVSLLRLATEGPSRTHVLYIWVCQLALVLHCGSDWLILRARVEHVKNHPGAKAVVENLYCVELPGIP